MKKTSLAEVLVKILGLSFTIYGISSFVTTISSTLYNAFQLQQISSHSSVVYPHNFMWQSVMTNALYGVVHFGLGLFLIFKTTYIVERMLKIEAET